MPIEFLYLATVFVVAIVGFSIIKRPLYECMLVAFLALVAITNTWGSIWTFIWDALTTSSLYVIIVFIVSAQLLSKTKIIDDCVAIILSIFGRIRGGAGYVAIIGSSYMGSLSGSGPGNVATTGVFTIPAMVRSGFPPHLAANVEAHASTMGNMIPPAGMVAIAFAALDNLYPNQYTMSQYWLLLWGIALWFILQRILTMYIMCRYHKVEAIKKEDLPSLRKVLKTGWKAIFLPIIVFLSFLLDSQLSEAITSRLGEAGKSAFSGSILLYIPSIIVIFGILLSGKETIKALTPRAIYQHVCDGMLKVIPTGFLVMSAYFVSNVLDAVNVGPAIGEFIASFDINLVVLALIIPLFTAVLGMLIPGSTQIKIFGGTIISVLAAAGANPFIVAGMLPCICGAMHGVTPPYAACLYVAMGIAEADLKSSTKNCLIWIGIHYLLSVLMIIGLVPILGLV